jgi:hypothetical protein
MAGFAGASPRTVERIVEVEMDGGQKLSGKVQLGPVFVGTDVGQYQLKPEQVRTIRLTRRVELPKEGPEGDPGLEGTVTTLSGKEVKGKVRHNSWKLDLEIGSLNLTPSKVKTMTFSAPNGGNEARSDRRPGPSASALKITTIEGPNVVALMVSGPRITRLAASREITGDWIPVDLREPVEGRANPIVGQGIAVYGLGRHVYAYSSETNRWDVLDLPAGTQANPIVGPGSARVENDGQVHEFNASTGRWKHIDTRAILNEIQDKALRALETERKP